MSELVKRLEVAENHFLQVLLDQFELKPRNGGYELRIEYDDSTPAVWNRHGRREIEQGIHDFRRRSEELQRQLDSLLLGNQRAPWSQMPSSFPFRWGNAGTLPIVRIDGADYICLFYRDITPVGWNIANGGTDNRRELEDPQSCIHRELREELIALDPTSGQQFILETDVDDPTDHPDFKHARTLWQGLKPEFRFDSWDPIRVAVRWIHGPDSLVVALGDGREVETDGYFLNINALDFGIEVDRIANFRLPAGSIVLDGEIGGGHLVRRPVGLFAVDRFRDLLPVQDAEYIPDIVFYDGERYAGTGFEKVLEKFISRVQGSSFRDRVDEESRERSKSPLGLCPVTSRIARHYFRYLGVRLDPKDYDIFLSYGGEDQVFAGRVHEALKKARPGLRIFYDQTAYSKPVLGRAIDAALDASRLLVAVGSRRRNLLRGWPEYEWRSFHNDILSGKKTGCEIVPLVAGIDVQDLPRPLRFRRALVCEDQERMEQAVKELIAIIDEMALGGTWG